MSIVKMKRIRLIALDRDKDELLAGLLHVGCVEISETAALGEDGDEALLSSYFRDEFLAQDPVLQVGRSDASPYNDYEIRGYDHRVRMVNVWSWPWEDVARAEIIESIPAIDGTIRSDRREAALAAGGEARLSPPKWASARYRVTLVRSAGRWKISNLQLIEQIKEE